MTKFKLFNAVWYDGEIAWVSKLILPTDKEWRKKEIARLTDIYGDELLKVDEIGDIEFEDILKLKVSEERGYKLAYERFVDMMNC